MSEMLERVARAIAREHYRRKQFYGACTLDERLDYLVGKYWDQFVPSARAAIAAMRTPTTTMCEAGAVRWHEGDWQTPSMPYLGDAGMIVWERAIDAALKE